MATGSEMESKSTSGVLRRRRPRSERYYPYRYYPYYTGSLSGKEDMKKEVVRLGVRLSVCVAESMFLLCDDIRTLLFFCLRLWKYVLPEWDPVLERLLLVMHYVYSKSIKPKNGLYHKGDGKSSQWKLIRTRWDDFVCGITMLHRLVLILRVKDCCFDDKLLSSAVVAYKGGVKKMEHALRSRKDVSEANGFSREAIESNIFGFWKSVFDEEAGRETQGVIKDRILIELFGAISGEALDVEIMALPLYSPYVLGRDFAKENMKKEVVLLGVKLSVYVAESMFLLCDEIRSTLSFCFKLWKDAKHNLYPNSPVLERLIRVIHYVHFKYIQPKNGVFHIRGRSVQMKLARPTLQNFDKVILYLDILVRVLGLVRIPGGETSVACSRDLTSSVEEELKKAEEKLNCGKAVSEANGFRREAIEPIILGLWKSLFDREAKEATETLETINQRILRDLFVPQVAP